MRLYVHTNVPSPYRRHQFELLATAFPGSRFYFHRKQSSFRPWSNSLDDWPVGCSYAGWCRQLLALFMQPWGTSHLFASVDESFLPNLVFRFFLLVSSLIGHSKVLIWNDAGFPHEVKPSKHLLMRLFASLCGKHFSAFSPGTLGRRFTMAQGFAANKIVNAYFSHDVERFVSFYNTHYQTARIQIRQKLNISQEKIVLLTVSRYERLKRLVDIAEALVLVEKKRPDLASRCEYILIGEGECQDHLPILGTLRFVKVHLVHQMPPDDVMAYYCSADISVFASEHDIWGLVVNEALSMGLPTICTDVVGAAEVVHEGENGYKVPVRSPVKIASAIQTLIENDALRGRFAENARTIRQYWRTEMGVSELEKYLKEC